MPLAKYRERYWYPDGSPAAGAQLYIYPRSGPPLLPLFADEAGTVPVPNPVVIPADGYVDVWMEHGDRWGYVNGQSFYLVIDLDPELTRVWPATFVHDHPAAETVWTIAHGLSSKPDVTCLGTSAEILFGEVAYQDDDHLTITFSGPTAGTAYLRR